MSFRDIRLPTRICEEFQGGPGFATAFARARSGYTTANIDRPDPIWEYEADAVATNTDKRMQLMGFFLVNYGMAYSFRFRDLQHYWTGCQSYAGIGDIIPLAPTDIPEFATGDGTTTQFQLAVPFSFGPYTLAHKITKPAKYGAADTMLDNPGYTGPRVWDETDLLTEGVDYTIDYSTGIVTFSAAPADTHKLRWAGLFDIHCRWKEDSINSILESSEAASMKLQLIEELAA